MSIQSLPAFFPRVMTSADILAMAKAYQLATTEQATTPYPIESDALSKVIYRLYSKGLIDPAKLAELAQLMAASPFFKRGDSADNHPS